MADDNSGSWSDVLSSFADSAAGAYESYAYSNAGYAGGAPVIYGAGSGIPPYGNPGAIGYSSGMGSSSLLWIVLIILGVLFFMMRGK